MKKLITFFAAFILWSMQTVFATNVSGTISTNTVWDLAGSPYVVTSSVTVNQGVTLTVESGVLVQFNNSQYLYINGTLNATNVIFTSSSGTPTPGIWGYIQIGNGSYAGTATMTNCQIQYAQRFYVYRGTATLDFTDLLNFSGNGVTVYNLGTLNMSNGNINTPVILSNTCGISSGTGSHVTITNVNIQHFTYGIDLLNNANFSLNNSSITNCTWPIFYSSSSADLTVSGTNTFNSNTNQVVCVWFSSFSDTLTLPTINIPYYFPNGMTVNAGARMVVGSNNILKFPNSSSGYIDVNGTFVANANAGEYIYFTSYSDDNWGGDSNNDGVVTAPSSGKWYGIKFQNSSSDANCLMRRCKVRYAGYTSIGGISMYDASPTIDSCDISNNYFGVYMRNASNPVFTNNMIGSSQMTPIAMSFEANPTMSNNSLSFSDNTYDAIGLIGGTLTADATIKIRSVTSVPNITYLMLDQVTIPVGRTLTINKGIVIKSYYSSHRILVNGALIANAAADSMITITSAKDDIYGNPADCNKDGSITSPAIGDYGGIIFNPGSTGILNYCRIKYARVNNFSFTTCSVSENLNEAAVAMIDVSPTISNCKFEQLNYGISCYRASNPVISNNDMLNITYTPFCISGSSNPTFTGNTFTNTGWRAIGLLGGNVCQNGTIKKRDVAGYTNITYILLADMTINSGTYVSVDSSVVIKMSSGSDIFVDGGFKTNGKSGYNVVLTSISDDNEGNPLDANGDGNGTTPAAGSWGSVKFRSSSEDAYCELNYTKVKYAGSTNVGGVTFENASGRLTNSSISNTSNYGLYCNGNSAPVIDNVIIQNCSLDPIAMSLTSDPTFANITFVSNSTQAIKIIEGTLSSNAVLAPRNVAGITNIAYIIEQLTISSNAKLTIQPDVVIKFRRVNNSYVYSNIVVNGNLIANGTPSHKIYFTSIKDDSKGGDSNNDGNTTVPAKEDWGAGWASYSTWNVIPGGIYFLNNSINADTVNSLKYCEISYTGTGVRVQNSHATIDNCLIQQAGYYGVCIIGSANPDIKNTQFLNITNAPVEMSMFSNPTFTNCSASNIGYMALAIIPETYSQSATVPLRNFCGYTNITYLMQGVCTINTGTTITVPAGAVFKSTNSLSSGGSRTYGSSYMANGFIVNGRINIQGSAGNPVVFTNDKDDSYGNPADMNQNGSATLPPYNPNSNVWNGIWFEFNDVSNDSSTIHHAVLKYGENGVYTLSASPIINNVRFEDLHYGVGMNGVSAPKIDSCTFHDLQFYPMLLSLVSYPASSSNNIISGRTYKVIKVRDETLTQDAILPKRNFGGVTNIPYFFNNYTVGTGAVLTINPGVVCKFDYINPYYGITGKLDIFKGFIALGGATPDSNIVFTSILDDYYGGDSNSDTTATTGTRGCWNGLIFEDQSIDASCRLKNCIIRYADKGISTTSASPSVEKCNINNNNYGVYAAAASNPVFSNCDFDNNYYFAINNVNKSFTINAENCWWGSNLGPIQTNTQGNGTSVRELVTTFVDYTPWITTGTVNPVIGDVSQNGVVQGYDASLTLQYVVSLISLNSVQQIVADVSGVSGITAYDASLISQYVVGLIQTFPAELAKSGAPVPATAQLMVGSANAVAGHDVTIPFSITNVSGMSAAEIKLQYDPLYLQVDQVYNLISGMNMLYSNDGVNGILTIAMEGVYALNADTLLASVTFHSMLPSGTNANTALTVNKFLANETDLTSAAINGSVAITDNLTTGVSATDESASSTMLPVYPNPSSGNAMFVYQLNGDNRKVNIEVFDLLGQKILTLVNQTQNHGKYSVSLSNQGSPLAYGSYFLKLTVDGVSQSQIFQIVR